MYRSFLLIASVLLVGCVSSVSEPEAPQPVSNIDEINECFPDPFVLALELNKPGAKEFFERYRNVAIKLENTYEQCSIVIDLDTIAEHDLASYHR